MHSALGRTHAAAAVPTVCVYRDSHAMGQSCTDLETVISASQLCWSKDRVSVQMAGMQIWYDHNLEVLVKHLCCMNSLLLLFLQWYKLQGERIEWKSRKNIYHKILDKSNQDWAELKQSWWQRPGCDSKVRLSSHVTFGSCFMYCLQGFLVTCEVSWVIMQEMSSKGLMNLKCLHNPEFLFKLKKIMKILLLLNRCTLFCHC